MTPQQYELVEAIFDEVCGLEPERRNALLDERCGDDPLVRREVEAMLTADDAGSDGLSAPAWPHPGETLFVEEDPSLREQSIPERIGRYHVVRECGHGGMGVVYEAEQDSPKRRVALKVLRTGVVSRQMLRRFRYEAEVLGRLQHPSIGQIFEAGSFDVGQGGQPFFAMEFIDGQSLIKHARDQNLSTANRLELMARVCDAVQYAHQRGVIHRDLKPENILVVTKETAGGTGPIFGQPKVLDFGIARLTNADVQMTTIQTDVGQLVGTLEYMSPEQAAGNASALDTRSDIYALGVICYELLTNRLPYVLKHQSVPQALRTIQENIPNRLSAHDVALRGDIETIVGKCLEKDRARRYPSASELAEDIRRYLRDEPISARPPSAFYQARMFARRNRALVGGVLATIVVLAAGVIVVSFLAVQANRLAEQSARSEASARAAAYRANISAASALVLDDPVTARQYLELAPSELRGWEWRHLNSVIDRHTLVYEAPVAAIGQMIFTPDGKYLLSALEDQSVAAWDAATGELARRLTIGSKITALAAPAAGPAKVAIGTDQGGVLEWDLSGQEPKDLFVFEEPSAVEQLAWDATAKRLAIAGGRRLMIWQGGRPLTDLPLDPMLRLTQQLEFSPDGATLAAICRGFQSANRLWLWDLQTTDLISATRLKDVACSLSFSADGTCIYVGNEERTIVPVDSRSLDPLGRLTGHQSYIIDVTRSRDGRLLASSSADGTIRLWDLEAGTTRAVLQVGAVSHIAFNPDDTQLVYRSGGSLQAWDLSAERSRVLRGHTQYVYHANWSRDGTLLVSAERHGPGIYVWDPVTGQAVASFGGSPRTMGVVGVWFSGDPRRILTSHFSLDSLTGQLDPRPDVLPCIPGGRHSTALSFSSDGSRFAISTVSHLYPTDITVGSCSGAQGFYTRPDKVDEIARFEGRYYGVALNPDGTLLAAGGGPDIDVWHIPTHSRITRLQGHTSNVYCVDFSPDGTRLASGGNDNTIRLWDTKSWEQVHEMRGHRQYVMSVSFSPDGTQLASASGDYTVRIWDTLTRAERAAQAREAAALREQVRPRIEALMVELADPNAVADRLPDEFATADERRAGLRVLMEQVHQAPPE